MGFRLVINNASYAAIILMLNYHYFVWKPPQISNQFRVVFREVKLRTRKGYPIAFSVKSIPDMFETWEKAQAEADRLNQAILQGRALHWEETEEVETE